MSLAGEDELDRACVTDDGLEALGVGEQQRRPLVGRGATGEADGQDVLIEPDFCPALDFGDERLLGAAVSFLDLVGGNGDGVAQVVVVQAPFRDLAVEQLLEGLRGPGPGVDAVGYGVDPVGRVHRLGYLAMALGHAVDVAREEQRQVGHVQGVVDGAGQGAQRPRPLLTQDLVRK